MIAVDEEEVNRDFRRMPLGTFTPGNQGLKTDEQSCGQELGREQF